MEVSEGIEVSEIERGSVAEWLSSHQQEIEQQVLDALMELDGDTNLTPKAAAVMTVLLRMAASDMPVATLAPEGRWYRRWRNLQTFVTWASPEALQIHQDTLRAAHEANAPTPLAPETKELG